MLSPEELLEAIRAKLDHPATVRELLQRLGFDRAQRVALIETGPTDTNVGDLQILLID